MTATPIFEPTRVICTDASTGVTVVLAMVPLPGATGDPGRTCTALLTAVEKWLRDPAALSTSAEPAVPVPPVAGTPASRLAEVRQWMRDNLAEPMSLDALAKRAFLSRRQFTRDFRVETGTSPARWLLEQRLAEATRLLSTTDLSVERIAETTGFPTPAAFRAHFKRRTKLTPSDFRRRDQIGGDEARHRAA